MEPLVLTFDIGTQSCRAALVDDRGTILAQAQKKFETPYFSLHPGWAEQNGEFYWASVCEVSLQLSAKVGELWDKIAAVSITTIRDTSICVDESGKPLRPAILWLDKREASISEPLPLMKQAIFAAIGMKDSIALIRKVSVCNWLMRSEPEIWKKTDKYLMLSGYMHFCLCGEMVDSTANIIGHVPFDSKKRCWMKPSDLVYCVFPIARDKLCRLCDPGDIVGKISKAAAEQSGIPEGLPLVATGSDKGCETLGLSCTTPEKASVSYGTTATIQYMIDRYVEPQQFFPAYPAALKGHYNPEIEIYRGFWLISWFIREFGEKEVKEAERLGVSAEELLNTRLREIPPGCEGLILQPYFTAGASMPKARGAIIGFSDVHTRIHIYRAIVEGIIFSLMDGKKMLEKRMKVKTQGIYLSGGGSQSSEICQITADMFGLPAYRSQTHEAAVIGSSIIAFCGIGRFSSIEEATREMVQIKDKFLPDMQKHELYEKLFKDIYSKIFDRLEPLYRKSCEMEER